MAAVAGVEAVIAAVRDGQPVLLPTDTVYGLATTAYSEDAAAHLYRLKGREPSQPTALIAASVEQLLELLPELDEVARTVVRTLLPGQYTLVLSNPARRFGWLAGTRPDSIGVRVAQLAPTAQRVLDAVGAIAATSANDPGGANPASLDDVPARIRAGCAAELDAGRLPGSPSTVIDFSGAEPRVLRDGAASAAEAIARIRA